MTNKRIEPRPFPTRYIQQLQAAPGNFVRLAPRPTPYHILTFSNRNDDPNPPFLTEAAQLCAGKEYSSFCITRLIYDEQTAQLCLDADISFPNPCHSITMYADIIDTASGTVVASFSPGSGSSCAQLHYDVCETLTANGTSAPLSVIVYAKWQPGVYSIHSAAILEDLQKDSVFTLDPVYPKKEDSFITFSDSETADSTRPDLPGLFTPLRQENIQIALFRKPDDRRDLDYLCEFGKDRAGRPRLGVPTFFTITSTGNLSFDVTKPVDVTCTISPLGTNTGGMYVVSSYHANAGMQTCATTNKDNDIHEHFQISATEKQLEVMMTGPWQESYPYGGNFRMYDFSYEVAVNFWVIDSRGTSRPYPTQYVSSVKGEGACLHHIPHISIRWGCFDEFTLITMADGRRCAIGSLRIGDIVAARDKDARITNIWRGEEDCHMLLSVKDHEIRLTKDHPILMADGTWRPAGTLKAGDQIQTTQGPQELLQCELIQKNIRVCNLSFAEKDTVVLIANEIFYTGDMDMQNSLLYQE